MTDRSDQEMHSEAERLLGDALPAEGSLEQAMSAMHEVYLGLKASGFKEGQCLWIIACVVGGGFDVDK